jgi:hypothetical protein
VDSERPRIPPGGRRRIGPLNAAIVRAIGRASGGRPPNVFPTLARNPAHHERLAQRAGFSAEEVERVRSGLDAPGWAPRQQLLLRACDEMHADGAIADPT